MLKLPFSLYIKSNLAMLKLPFSLYI
jgi:hypothetical protein